jgi:hypothetical protein
MFPENILVTLVICTRYDRIPNGQIFAFLKPKKIYVAPPQKKKILGLIETGIPKLAKIE